MAPHVPPGAFPWRAIISVVETVAAAVVAIAGFLHGGTVPDLLGILGVFGTAHGLNHPAGGSPI